MLNVPNLPNDYCEKRDRKKKSDSSKGVRACAYNRRKDDFCCSVQSEMIVQKKTCQKLFFNTREKSEV